MYFSGDDLDSMARAWPLLTRLRIRDEEASLQDQDRVAHVPAASLLAFATHCSALETLELWPLYATESSCDLEHWSLSASSPCALQLQQLTMYTSPCAGGDTLDANHGCEELMLRFLQATFPNAKYRCLEK
ncbi:hypothetical protein NUW54_g10097 [Trametes sanguinea]|uniref:Uncharacterized protein n=1 Tax=Trametes sanguinea TaxID=158606 RepID=A0ACC1P2Q7_9APHY|nr:hypothetical protein NUW54_g10097 [Trametes sanguinea]